MISVYITKYLHQFVALYHFSEKKFQARTAHSAKYLSTAWMSGVQFLTGQEFLCLHQCVQTSCEVNTASYPMCTGDSSPGRSRYKVARAWSNHLLPLSVKVENTWSFTFILPVYSHVMVLSHMKLLTLFYINIISVEIDFWKFIIQRIYVWPKISYIKLLDETFLNLMFKKVKYRSLISHQKKCQSQ